MSEIKIVPARRFSVVNDELWYVTRYISTLIKYSFKTQKAEYIGSPAENNMLNPYAFSSCFYFNHKILCVPTFEDLYCIYEVGSGKFRKIKSNFSKKGLRFDGAIQYNNFVICFPVKCDYPVVVFDMITEREIAQVKFSNEFIDGNSEVAASLSMVSDSVYGLLYPNNILFKYMLKEQRIVCERIEGCNGVVDSIYKTENGLMFHCMNNSYVSYRIDGSNKEITYEVEAKGKVEFAGFFNGGVVVDSVGSLRKVMIDTDSNMMNYIDESSHAYPDSKIWTFGTAMSDENEGDYYLSGCSNGVYSVINNSVMFNSFTLTDGSLERINTDLYKSLKKGNVIQETALLGLSEYIDRLI